VDGAKNAAGVTATGTVSLTLTLFSGPPNDLFANGITITATSPSTGISNIAAGPEAGEPGTTSTGVYALGHKTLWYR
jgi:hypothetical protein